MDADYPERRMKVFLALRRMVQKMNASAVMGTVVEPVKRARKNARKARLWPKRARLLALKGWKP